VVFQQRILETPANNPQKHSRPPRNTNLLGDSNLYQGQPLYHAEVLGLAQGYRQLTGRAPPPGHDDPLARARPRGDQSWQPSGSSVGSDAAATAGGPDALAPAAAGARPDSVGRGASSSALSAAGGEHQRATPR
jgi:hypothetical protein